MARYIITGNYTASAMAGLVAHPSDRAAATGALVAAAGGKLVDFYLTTGARDFMLVVEADDMKGMLAASIVASASGATSNMQTVQAFTAAEFLEAQKKASAITKAYATPT